MKGAFGYREPGKESVQAQIPESQGMMSSGRRVTTRDCGRFCNHKGHIRGLYTIDCLPRRITVIQI